MILTIGAIHGHPVEVEDLEKAIEVEKALDLEGGILPKTVRQRMSRFFTDSADSGSAGGNLVNLGLDSNAVLTVSKNDGVVTAWSFASCHRNFLVLIKFLLH